MIAPFLCHTQIAFRYLAGEIDLNLDPRSLNLMPADFSAEDWKVKAIVLFWLALKVHVYRLLSQVATTHLRMRLPQCDVFSKNLQWF